MNISWNIWTFKASWPFEHWPTSDTFKVIKLFWLPLALSLVCYIDQFTMCFFSDKFPTWIFPIPLKIQVPWKILSQPPILLCEFDTTRSGGKGGVETHNLWRFMFDPTWLKTHNNNMIDDDYIRNIKNDFCLSLLFTLALLICSLHFLAFWQYLCFCLFWIARWDAEVE